MNFIPQGAGIGEVGLRVARIMRRDASVKAARALRESRFGNSSIAIHECLNEFRSAFLVMIPQADWDDVQAVKGELHKDDDWILNNWVTLQGDKIMEGEFRLS